MVETVENPLGAALILLLIIGYRIIKYFAKQYKNRRLKRQQAQDDLLLAYIAWLKEQDLLARQEYMAQARKQSTPSFQDFNFKKVHN